MLVTIKNDSRYVILLLLLWAFQSGVFASPQPTIVILGDSLSSGHGIRNGLGWVDLLALKLKQESMEYRMINASISGDTSGNGLNRLERILKQYEPEIVIVELGGNDGLRGFKLAVTESNLKQIVLLNQQHHARTLLVGMRMPPNYGPVYTQKFQQIFKRLAARYQLPLLPFLLEGIATNKVFMQSDGIHPNQKAQSIILENVWPVLKKMLDDR